MKALLFVHAFPCDSSMWETQVRSLRSEADVVLAPSLPGFGGTPPPASQPAMDDYADSLARSLDDARVERAAVIGLSMGGYVAFAMWRRHRARIAGLVLADTRAEADDAPGKERRERLAALVRERGTAALLLQPPPWLRDGSPRWDALREIVKRQPAEAVAQASIAMSLRRDSTELLPGIDVPTAVVVGENDAITPPPLSETMAKAIPGATLTRIRSAGHLANMDAPDAFDRAVRDLVRRVTWPV